MFWPLALAFLAQSVSFERVSIDSSEQQANWISSRSAISSDGRYVVFESIATNLVANDTNNYFDVFVRDRTLGTTERVSLTSSGGEMAGSGVNFSPYLGISANGQSVIFVSPASNLVSGDSNLWDDVFLRRRDTSTTSCVTVTPSGAPGNLGGGYCSISDNGRYVAFYSSSTDLTSEAQAGIFVRDLDLGTTRFVSSGGPPWMSPGGRYVSFVYFEVGAPADIYRWDMRTGNKVLVSIAADGSGSNGDSFDNCISADGRYVAFSSRATNLVAGDAQDTLWSVFVRDLQAGTTVKADAGAAQYGQPRISPSGRYVSWGGAGLWVRDLQAGSPVQIADGLLPGTFTADAALLSLMSDDDRLVVGDTNDARDVFVWIKP